MIAKDRRKDDANTQNPHEGVERFADSDFFVLVRVEEIAEHHSDDPSDQPYVRRIYRPDKLGAAIEIETLNDLLVILLSRLITPTSR